ncbi:MAG: hypothetical protein ACR2N4_04055 [Jatrophihabitans sp.]
MIVTCCEQCLINLPLPANYVVTVPLVPGTVRRSFISRFDHFLVGEATEDPPMTANTSDAVRGDSGLFADIVNILAFVTGEGPDWAAGIEPAARLETDLRMESVELAEFDQALRRRFGDRVDLAGHLASLDLDQLVGLSVAEVTGYVAGQLAAGRPR